MFDVVVAADLDWGIGKANALPWPKLRGDLAHFKRVTGDAPDGHRNAIIMGRRTWESAEVAARPLPKRLNIIISRGTMLVPDGVLAAKSLDEALASAARIAPAAVTQRTASAGLPVQGGAVRIPVATTFVIGGAQIFRDAFTHPALRYVYLTRIAGRFAADTHIPNLDALGLAPSPWDGASDAEESGVRYRIERLARR